MLRDKFYHINNTSFKKNIDIGFPVVPISEISEHGLLLKLIQHLTLNTKKVC